MEKRSQTILIISGLIFLLSLAMAYFLVMPAYKQIGVQDSQIQQMKAQIDLKKNYYATVESKARALEDAGWAEKKKSIEVNFISSPFFTAKLNAFFKTLVAGSGTTFSSFTSSSPVSARTGAAQSSSDSEVKISTATETKVATTYFDQLQGPVNKISCNLIVSGTYSAFKKLLSDMESQTRIITVKSIAVSSSSEQGTGKKAANVSSFNLVIDVYSY
jgi:Tfp pilus assembly protein PilO